MSLIEVTTTYRPGRLGPVYREGAMVEVILRDADGKQVDVQTQRPEAPLVFTDLRAGTYILEPGLRPCDGNCGYLDPRLDTCTRTLEVDGRVKVKVDFIIGSACRVRTTPPPLSTYRAWGGLRQDLGRAAESPTEGQESAGLLADI